MGLTTRPRSFHLLVRVGTVTTEGDGYGSKAGFATNSFGPGFGAGGPVSAGGSRGLARRLAWRLSRVEIRGFHRRLARLRLLSALLLSAALLPLSLCAGGLPATATAAASLWTGTRRGPGAARIPGTQLPGLLRVRQVDPEPGGRARRTRS